MNAYFNMYLGTELKDKLDETFFSMLPIHSWVTARPAHAWCDVMGFGHRLWL